jgi:tetratricopeptide (TPR) repeat protein
MNRKDKAEKYYLAAVEKGVVEALNNLANLYVDLNHKEEAEKYYLAAVEKGNVSALFNLANLYADLNLKVEAEKYYLMAVEKGDVEALNNLASFYDDLNRKEEAEKYYLAAVEKGDVEALNNLAILYVDLNRMEEAEKYYLMAIENGKIKALRNLSILYYSENKNIEKAYSYITQYNLKVKNDLTSIAFELILSVWAGKPEKLEEAGEVISDILKSEDINFLKLFATEMLIHHQLNTVWQWFKDAESGQTLKEKLRPLFYVTARLINNEETREKLQAMAPELEETANSIYNSIIKRQQFYYGQKK